MEPCANEVSGLLKGGILFLFQGSNTQALSCFREPTPCSQVLGHTLTTAASLTGPGKPRCQPLLFPPQLTTLTHLARSRDVSVCQDPEQCPAETRPFHVQGPPKVREMLRLPPGALGSPWWPQAHTGFGSSTAPKVFRSRGTIRNCCGCSTGHFLKGNLQG